MLALVTTADKINAIVCFLATAAVALYIVGLCAYSDEHENIKRTHWFREKNNDLYFGLRGVTGQQNDQGGGSGHGVTEYHDCGGNACDDCDKDGKAAFALTLFSLVMAFLVAALAWANVVKYDHGRQAAKIAFSTLAWIASVIAIGLVMGQCRGTVEDDFHGSYEWGPGAICTLVALLLMFINMCLLSAAAGVAEQNPNANHGTTTNAGHSGTSAV
jgi:di/tricarboxylate transporter